MPSWLSLLLLLPAGIFAGVVNTIAGGGSFVTLPLLMLYGLPAQIANGTNRVAILMQTAYASSIYDRHSRMDRSTILRLLTPLLPGALLGAYVASAVSREIFSSAVGGLFLGFTVLLILKRRHLVAGRAKPIASAPTAAITFFAVGFYGGFLQAGVGLLLLLSITAFLGRELAESNGLKQVAVAAWTIPAVAWFAFCGQVSWVPGLVLGIGNLIGARLGARLAISRGNGLIFGCLVAVMLLTSVHLLITSLH